MYIFNETDGFFMILLRERDLDTEDEMYSRSSILILKDFKINVNEWFRRFIFFLWYMVIGKVYNRL